MIQWQALILKALAVFVTAGLPYHLALENIVAAAIFTFPGGVMGKIIWLYSVLTAGMIASIFCIGLLWLPYHNFRNAPLRVAFNTDCFKPFPREQ